MLGGDVGGHAFDAEQARVGGSVDDRATATLLEHLSDFGLHAEPYAGQIDRDYAGPILLGTLVGDGECALDTGIVERAIETSVGLNRFRDEALGVGRFGDVGLDEDGGGAGIFQQLDGFGSSRFDQIGEHEFRALAREDLRGRASDTGAGAGDQRDFAIQDSSHQRTSVAAAV